MRRVFKILVLAFMCIGLWDVVDRTLVLKRDDGITTMQNYYLQDKNTVDVLVLGTSHVGTNIDIETLWSEYGYSTYSLWGSLQPFWNSYHFLLEAIKSQDIKLVVVDLYAASFEDEYSDEARQVTNTAGMKYSINKWNAVKVSAPKERWIDLFLGLPLYHTRYQELTKDDFNHYNWNKELVNQKGGSTRYGSYWEIDLNYDINDETKPLLPKQEEYLRKIIEVCRNNNIELMFVVTPTANRSFEQPYYNYVEEIAKQESIPFYNFNRMDEVTKLDSGDFSIDNNHLNTSGARKVTKVLGKLIHDDFKLEDHRNDDRYVSWDKYAYNSNVSYLRQVGEWDEYIKELKRDGFGYIAIGGPEDKVNGTYWDTLPIYLEKVNISNNLKDKDIEVIREDGRVIININGKEVYNQEDQEWMIYVVDKDTCEYVDDAVFAFDPLFLLRQNLE